MRRLYLVIRLLGMRPPKLKKWNALFPVKLLVTH